MNGREEVYNRHYDTAGNYHWTGVRSGEHKVEILVAVRCPVCGTMKIDGRECPWCKEHKKEDKK